LVLPKTFITFISPLKSECALNITLWIKSSRKDIRAIIAF